MIRHITLPGIPLTGLSLDPTYIELLKNWRLEVINGADSGVIAASDCHQGALIDLVLDGELRYDWLGAMNEYLMSDNKPIAYSEGYGKRLHKFEGQYLQSTIHAIHTRWWIEQIQNSASIDYDYYLDLILAKKQSDGLFYDIETSETILRHRMKTELTMSMAMAVEIIKSAGRLTDGMAMEMATNITSPGKCPSLGYISMEYFRLVSLRMLGKEQLFPPRIEDIIDLCAEGLEVGWGDFSMRSKIDAYMGTAKRIQRDKPIHSPLIACYILTLIDRISDPEKAEEILQRLENYCIFMRQNPMQIPAFQMRDIPIPFGHDVTPIEIICSSFLIGRLRAI